jgi:GNAT superfamily N-acetyltransferase
MSTESTGTPVVPLQAPEVRAAARVLARAFVDGELWVHVFPDASERLWRLKRLFAFMLRYTRYFGTVDTCPELAGVALWLPHDKADMSVGNSILVGGLGLPTRLGPMALGRLLAADGSMTAYRRRFAPVPHEYLILLGVSPEHQGEGIGATLVRHGLERLRVWKRPCYLETQHEQNVPMYQHIGFELKQESVLPGTSVKNWCFLQKPHDPMT